MNVYLALAPEWASPCVHMPFGRRERSGSPVGVARAVAGEQAAGERGRAASAEGAA